MLILHMVPPEIISGLIFNSIVLIAFGAYYNGIVLLWCIYTACMLGLLLTKNWLMFIFFWEAVSLFSFLMIGEAGTSAFLINLFGSTCLLSTFIVPASYMPYLLGIAILAKSAQFPFNRWIYQVSVAPDYLSAYLHASTLIQCGIILLSRLQYNSEILDWILWSSGSITALSCMFKQDGKNIIVCATQVFIATMLILYSTNHTSLWPEILNHMYYKPALFLMIYRVADRFWWSVGVLNAIVAIYHYSTSIMFLPNVIMCCRIIEYLDQNRPTSRSFVEVVNSSMLSTYPFISIICSFISPSLFLTLTLFVLAFAMNLNALFLFWIGVILSRYAYIEIPEIKFPTIKFCSVPVLGIRFCAAIAILALAFNADWSKLDYKLLYILIAAMFLIISSISLPLVLLLGWCATTYLSIAPDVMITQISVDAIIMLYLIGARYESKIRWFDLLLALVFGVILYCSMTEPQALPLVNFDSNAVNTVVADKRALDTWGEICVFGLAGMLLKNIPDHIDSTKLEPFWAFPIFKQLLLAIASMFLFRGEIYGIWIACALMVLFRAPVGLILAAWMAVNLTGHSGGFAAGVTLGIYLCFGSFIRPPLGLILAAIGAQITQWALIGHHSMYASAWGFEVCIALLVAWSVRRGVIAMV